jgi:aspartyl-tRNA(Asn)/glutamyl-tRNA(Gln) amidotransferase subunit A
MALHQNRSAERDAEVVATLRRAGAAIIGTLNMEEAALGAKTDNPWFGATQNPHRIGHSPGGSSGGSGAAVAAGLCDAALGTDTMGSVRVPAAYCGIYGFKPAQDAASDDGIEPCEPFLDVPGPLARDLDTLERVAAVISDVGDHALTGAPLTLAGLGGVECHPAVLAMENEAANVLGVTEALTLPHPLSRVRFAGFIRSAKALAAHFAEAPPEQLSDNLRRLIAYGPRRSPADWAEDQAVMQQTADVLRDAVERRGPLVLPTVPGPAFPHSQAAPANQADFTCLANIAVLPAITLPAGWADGLPIAMQIIGRRGEEAALFALARRLDSALYAYRRPPHFFEGA